MYAGTSCGFTGVAARTRAGRRWRWSPSKLSAPAFPRPMLDLCSISHKGGIVLWSRAFTPDAERLAASPASPLNSLVRDALVEGRSSDEKYEKDGYAVSWTFVNELELIFVVCHASVLFALFVRALSGSLPAYSPTHIRRRAFECHQNVICEAVWALLDRFRCVTACCYGKGNSRTCQLEFCRSSGRMGFPIRCAYQRIRRKGSAGAYLARGSILHLYQGSQERKARLRGPMRAPFETPSPPSDDQSIGMWTHVL